MASFLGWPTNDLVCKGATISGGAAEALIAKEYANALTSVAQNLATQFIINRTVDHTHGEASETAQKDWGACVSAAMAVANSMTRFNSMEQSKKGAQESYQLAQEVSESSDSALAFTGGNSKLSASGEREAAQIKGGKIAEERESLARTEKNNSTSLQQKSGATMASVMDSSLPDFVKSPGFLRDYRKASGGKDFNELLEDKNIAAKDALMQSLSGVLTSEGKQNLASLLPSLNSSNSSSRLPNPIANNGVDGTEYSAGAGGGGSRGSGNSMDFNSMLGGIFDQFLPKKPGEKNQNTSGLVFYGSSGQPTTRTPASIFGDSTRTLFERVSARYQHQEIFQK
jgi:hypothetical protein